MNSIADNLFDLLFNENSFELFEKSTNLPFRTVKNEKYKCIEYDLKINLLTFCKLYLPIKITIIGFPVSICEKGYQGDLDTIFNDYKTKDGIFLFLNDNKTYTFEPDRSGRTLSNCVFDNKFKTFSEYLNSLRSSYRRRINIAIKKGNKLKIQKIKNTDFTDEIHNLYLNVLRNSKYPLETLNKNFFRLFESEIYVWYADDKPIAFVQLKELGGSLNFIFGGMDYKYRNQYDLYFNMLIFILKKGIEKQCKVINFGQTAESAKMRIGCKMERRYMHIIAGNKVIDFILTKLIKYIEYREVKENLKVFKDE